jgi:hypothetical protein
LGLPARRYDDVLRAVAQVAHRDDAAGPNTEAWYAGIIADGRPEGPVAVAERHDQSATHVASRRLVKGTAQRDDEIEPAVAVQVREDLGDRICPDLYEA